MARQLEYSSGIRARVGRRKVLAPRRPARIQDISDELQHAGSRPAQRIQVRGARL